MVRPSQLCGQDIHLVVERLRNNTMRWVGLTKAQCDEVAAEVEELCQSGAAKPRWERSDKNQPRGPRTKKTAAGDAGTDDSDNESSKDDGSGDESDKGDAGSGDGRPRLPIVSPFVAVQSADSPQSPAPFATTRSPIPIPTAMSLATPAPAVSFAGGGCPVPSPIPTATSLATPAPAVPFASRGCPVSSPISTAMSFRTPAPAVPFDILVQNPTPASLLGGSALLPPSHGDSFALDFDDMDLTMGPFVPQPDSSTNDFDGANWRLNTSNRDDDWSGASGIDGSTPNATPHASGGTGLNTGLFSGAPYAQGLSQDITYMQGYLQGAPYMQGSALGAQGSAPGAQGNAHHVQGNPYTNAPLHAQSAYPATAGPFMSVFSVSTNTSTTRKRKRVDAGAEGDAGKKAKKHAPKKRAAAGEGTAGRAC
ncbi:hypothetical protein B0H14DRAFT_3476781 [Mycena olivaceomarginata]|nr:hypothetical protein B0H14DRAFT_3476781 [Mycena olivaceomarginata]